MLEPQAFTEHRRLVADAPLLFADLLKRDRIQQEFTEARADELDASVDGLAHSHEPAPISWTPLMSRNARGCVHGTQEETEFHTGVQG
jgi:hypothetical protein